jgi:hypothetical protein
MQQVTSAPGSVTIRGKTFAIPEPTPTDLSRIRNKMRELALASCTSPILAVNAVAKDLAPAVLAAAIADAVRQMAGGGVEPSDDAVRRQFQTVEGVRFQLWYLANRGGARLTLDEAAGLVDEENVFEVDDAIYAATQLGNLPGPKASGTGPG